MLRFHHVSCLVDDIDESIGHYQNLFQSNKICEKFYISSQGVYVCFIEMANNVYVELVQPVGEDSVVANLRRKGFNYYHMGYLVKDIDKTIEDLESMGYKYLNSFNSDAFNNNRCAFLYSPDMHLTELIEE